MSLLKYLIFAQLLLVANGYVAPSTVQKLYDDLTTGYDLRLRPTRDQNSSVDVYVTLSPYELLELSTSEQKLTIIVTVSLTWTDEFLVWNATDYGGIEHLVFSIGEIWNPRLLLGMAYKNEHKVIGDAVGQMSVRRDGIVKWTPDSIVSVTCKVDITFYPFDTQTCGIAVYVPYTSYDAVELHHIVSAPFVPQDDHPEWFFEVGKPTERRIPPGGKKMLIFPYTLRRRAEFVIYTTIVPLILLSVLNACVVLVPVSSGEKGSIAVTLFLSYCVYLTAIGQTLPPNSVKSSYLLMYMTIVQCFSALTMLYSIVETRMYITGNWHALSGFCCSSKSVVSPIKDGVIGVDYPQTEPNYTEKEERPCVDVLTFYKKLDNAVFLTGLVLNTVVVMVFAILTTNKSKG